MLTGVVAIKDKEWPNALLVDEKKLEGIINHFHCHKVEMDPTKGYDYIRKHSLGEIDLETARSEIPLQVMPFTDLLLNENDYSLVYSSCFKCSLGFIDYSKRPDGDSNYLLVYQDEVSKFTILKPLKEKSKDDLHQRLFEIFSVIGVPAKIYSKEKPLIESAIKEDVGKFCQDFSIKVRRPKTKDFEDNEMPRFDGLINRWVESNNSNRWGYGLNFVMFKHNCDYNKSLQSAPFTLVLQPNYTYTRRKYTRYLIEKGMDENAEAETDERWLNSNEKKYESDALLVKILEKKDDQVDQSVEDDKPLGETLPDVPQKDNKEEKKEESEIKLKDIDEVKNIEESVEITNIEKSSEKLIPYICEVERINEDDGEMSYVCKRQDTADIKVEEGRKTSPYLCKLDKDEDGTIKFECVRKNPEDNIGDVPNYRRHMPERTGICERTIAYEADEIYLESMECVCRHKDTKGCPLHEHYSHRLDKEHLDRTDLKHGTAEEIVENVLKSVTNMAAEMDEMSRQTMECIHQKQKELENIIAKVFKDSREFPMPFVGSFSKFERKLAFAFNNEEKKDDKTRDKLEVTNNHGSQQNEEERSVMKTDSDSVNYNTNDEMETVDNHKSEETVKKNNSVKEENDPEKLQDNEIEKKDITTKQRSEENGTGPEKVDGVHEESRNSSENDKLLYSVNIQLTKDEPNDKPLINLTGKKKTKEKSPEKQMSTKKKSQTQDKKTIDKIKQSEAGLKILKKLKTKNEVNMKIMSKSNKTKLSKNRNTKAGKKPLDLTVNEKLADETIQKGQSVSTEEQPLSTNSGHEENETDAGEVNVDEMSGKEETETKTVDIEPNQLKNEYDVNLEEKEFSIDKNADSNKNKILLKVSTNDVSSSEWYECQMKSTDDSNSKNKKRTKGKPEENFEKICLVCDKKLKKRKISKPEGAIVDYKKGSTAKVRVSVMDRPKGCPNYFLAVIVGESPKGEYRLATHHGFLKESFKKDQLSPCSFSLFKPGETPEMAMIDCSQAIILQRDNPHLSFHSKCFF